MTCVRKSEQKNLTKKAKRLKRDDKDGKQPNDTVKDEYKEVEEIRKREQDALA